MSSVHWKAFKDIGDTFMRDTKSVIYYAFSSWLNEKIDEQVETTFPNNNAMYYLADGVTGTLNQDYLLNLTGLQNRLPSETAPLKPINPPNPPGEEQNGVGLLTNRNYYEHKPGFPRFYY